MRIQHGWLLLLGITAALAVAGCGSAPGTTTGSGYGSDAGPWPTPPPRNIQSSQDVNRPAADQVPNAPLTVLLRGKASEKDELQVDIARIEFKYSDRWLSVATREDIARHEKLPIAITEKGAAALLVSTKVPKRKYSHLRIRFTDSGTVLKHADAQTPLTIQETTLVLNDWELDEQKPNTLAISLDGTTITRTEDSATLPSSGVKITEKGIPAGSITGKTVPALPTASIEVFWGNGAVSFGAAHPDARDGSFTLPNLPAGSYRIAVHAPGHRLIDPFTDLVSVGNKAVKLRELALTTAAKD